MNLWLPSSAVPPAPSPCCSGPRPTHEELIASLDHFLAYYEQATTSDPCIHHIRRKTLLQWLEAALNGRLRVRPEHYRDENDPSGYDGCMHVVDDPE